MLRLPQSSLACRHRISSGRVHLCAPSRRTSHVARVTSVRQWPDAEFVQETRALYEGLGLDAKPIADPEEARVLLSIGYVFLDVRSQLEVDATGRIQKSVHIPWVIASKKWDSAAQNSVVQSYPNKDFVKQVERQFPNKERILLLVADCNGRSGSGGQEALMALDEAGYINLVGMVGGFDNFWRYFDGKLNRRAKPLDKK